MVARTIRRWVRAQLGDVVSQLAGCGQNVAGNVNSMVEVTAVYATVGTCAALLFGMSFTGVPPMGAFAAALLATVAPPVQSSGLALPVLVVGAMVAVAMYGRSAKPRMLLRLVPETAVGLGSGYAVMRFLPESITGRALGLMVFLAGTGELWRRQARRRALAAPVAGRGAVNVVLGTGAGFSTMVANAGGPMMSLFLMRQALPTSSFLGTSACFFLAVNLLKVPLSVALGLITPHSLVASAVLLPGLAAGLALGEVFSTRASARLFETLVLASTVLAGAWLTAFA
ncbi:MAG: TSUP family transporter [Acidimicrobiales bacterium]